MARISRLTVLVIQVGLLWFRRDIFGIYKSRLTETLPLKCCQASSVSKPLSSSVQGTASRKFRSPPRSPFLKSNTFSVELLCLGLNRTSSEIIAWSLLPKLPSCSMLRILSGLFAKTKSNVFPRVWVGKSTICSKLFSSVQLRKFSRERSDCSVSQFIDGKLKSPIIRLFWLQFSKSLHNNSVFSCGALGGL